MRRVVLVAMCLGVALSTAMARPPMETSQLVDDTGAALGTASNPLQSAPPATPGYATQRTTGIGTAAVQVSAADATNRRTVTNVNNIACEIVQSGAAYGTGYPLAAAQTADGVGGSFTFDASGRTTAALYVACASAGGKISVLSY